MEEYATSSVEISLAIYYINCGRFACLEHKEPWLVNVVFLLAFQIHVAVPLSNTLKLCMHLEVN